MNLVPETFSLAMDFGHAEVYQYVKEYWAILLLLAITIKKKHTAYFAWSLLFLYLLLDDALGIHEIFGHYLVEHYNIPNMFHLRGQDIGELLVSAASGFLLFTFIGISYLFSSPTTQRVSRYLFALVICLAFFGVLMDMCQIATPFGKPVFGLLEDGGEMLIMSITVWYIIDLKITQNNHTPLATTISKSD